jgi:hypothetical protein
MLFFQHYVDAIISYDGPRAAWGDENSGIGNGSVLAGKLHEC